MKRSCVHDLMLNVFVKCDDGPRSMLNRKGVELVIGRLASTNPKAKGQTPEALRAFEPSILDELKKSGFTDRARRS